MYAEVMQALASERRRDLITSRQPTRDASLSWRTRRAIRRSDRAGR